MTLKRAARRSSNTCRVCVSHHSCCLVEAACNCWSGGCRPSRAGPDLAAVGVAGEEECDALAASSVGVVEEGGGAGALNRKGRGVADCLGVTSSADALLPRPGAWGPATDGQRGVWGLRASRSAPPQSGGDAVAGDHPASRFMHACDSSRWSTGESGGNSSHGAVVTPVAARMSAIKSLAAPHDPEAAAAGGEAEEWEMLMWAMWAGVAARAAVAIARFALCGVA